MQQFGIFFQFSNAYKRDLENISNPIYTVKAHKEIINCIDGVAGLGIGEGAPEILTASRDGRINFKKNS